MKISNKFLRFGRSSCAALILFLPATIQSQTTPGSKPPNSNEIAAALSDLHSKRPNSERLASVRTLGFELTSAARYEDAWSVFKAILEVTPGDQQALYGGALALLNLKQLKQAREMAESAIDAARNNSAQNDLPDPQLWRARESDSLVLLGVILAIERDNDGALRALRRAVELAPSSFDAQFALARALYGTGDLSNAAFTFHKAVLLRPGDFQALFFLGTTLEAAGEYEQARQTYAELIRRHPDKAEGHLGLGVLLMKLDGTKAAEGINELSKAVALKGDLYEARIALGRGLIKTGRYKEALEHLNQASLLAPGNPEPHYQLAIAYRRLGKTANAESESAKVKEINSARRSGDDGLKSKPNN